MFIIRSRKKPRFYYAGFCHLHEEPGILICRNVENAESFRERDDAVQECIVMRLDYMEVTEVQDA